MFACVVDAHKRVRRIVNGGRTHAYTQTCTHTEREKDPAAPTHAHMHTHTHMRASQHKYQPELLLPFPVVDAHKRARRVNNGAVPRAPAQVSVERILDVCDLGAPLCGRSLEVAEERHGNAGRAVAAVWVGGLVGVFVCSIRSVNR